MAARFPEPQRPIDPIEDQINKFFDHVILCVNERRSTLLVTAEKTRNARIEKFRRGIEGGKQLEAVKEEVEKILKENILHETKEQIMRIVERKREDVKMPLAETGVVFRGEYGNLEKLIATLGEIREEVPAVPKYEGMRSIVAVGKKGKASGELWYPNAVAIDMNTNYIYVAEGHPFEKFPRISIFSDVGEFLNIYTHKHMKRPEGIAIHTNNMYITDTGKHAVFQFKIESDIRLVTKIGTRGDANGEFICPTNLAVSASGDVYVADYDNNRVQVLDSSLHYKGTLTEQLIMQPRDIKLTADSVYVLCDVSPCISVFSYTGDMLRSLLTRGHQLQVNNALYFCLDSQENIIISDSGAHSIKAFTKEGTLIHTIGESGREADGTFINPRGLALSDEFGLVALFCNDTYCLQTFSSP